MGKYKTTATVCRYAVEIKKVSHRAMSRLLGIHHSTWQRFVNGSSSPAPPIRYKLVRLMEASNFEELIQQSFRYYYRNG